MNRPALKIYSTLSPLVFGTARILSGLHSRLATFHAVRENLFEDLERQLDTHKNRSFRLWVHAASVGEFEQARPVITALREQHPDITLFVSFLSDSGYNARKNFPSATAVFYLPADTPANAKRLIRLLRPDLLLLIRYDFWPNHLLEAKIAGAKLVLAAAVLRERSVYRNPLLRRFYRELFALFERIYTVSDNDTRVFRELFGSRQAETAGDPRFDQVIRRSANTEKIARLEPFYRHKPVLVAGSVWEKDETLLLQAWRRLENRPALVLVPHRVERENMNSLFQALEAQNIPYKADSDENTPFDPDRQVLVVDRTGFLAELYSLASIAYVGGGFGVNVHNTLEPAVYGIPVVFGPRHRNSPEAEALVRAGGGTVIHDEESLFQVLRRFSDHPTLREEAGSAAGRFVKTHAGGTSLIAGFIEDDLLAYEAKR